MSPPRVDPPFLIAASSFLSSCFPWSRPLDLLRDGDLVGLRLRIDLLLERSLGDRVPSFLSLCSLSLSLWSRSLLSALLSSRLRSVDFSTDLSRVERLADLLLERDRDLDRRREPERLRLRRRPCDLDLLRDDEYLLFLCLELELFFLSRDRLDRDRDLDLDGLRDTERSLLRDRDLPRRFFRRSLDRERDRDLRW